MKKQSIRINKTAVDALSPGDFISDDRISGFYCRCQKKGKFYSLKYYMAGSQLWYTIGRHGDGLTADKARKEAERLRSLIRQGVDIVNEKKKKAKEQTISELADRYFTQHVQKNNKPSTQSEVDRIIKKRIKPELGHFKISQITRMDIRAWHDKMVQIPYEANRALAYFSKMMSLATSTYELRKENPCIGINKHREEPRKRSFSDEQMQQIGKALVIAKKSKEFSESCINAVWLLAFTGCRLGEILSLKWEEVDLKQKRINLTDAKTGDRTVSLGDETVALLEEFSKKGTYVLNGDVPLNESALRRFWTWVKETAQIPEDARPHDFRHTAATYAAQADHNAFALRDFMGHKTIAMTNRYVDRAKNPALAAANSVSSRVATDMKKPTSRKKKIIK